MAALLSVDNAWVEMTLAWWCVPYLITLAWVAELMDTAPKSEHVEWILEKAARFTVIRNG